MTDLLGIFAYLLLPLIGIAVWRLKGVRDLALDGRLAIAGATGAVILAMVMSAMALIGVQWSRTRISIVLAAAIAAGLWKLPRRHAPRTPFRRSPALAAIAVLAVITAYGLLTARETIGDLLFFWGPKAVHFTHAGTIDVDYLRHPDNYMAHRDYPPLLPLLLAWSHIVSRQFSWWGAVLLSGFILAGIVAVIRACARDDLGALLAASILAWTFARARVAGGADPLLLFFEVVAVAALLFLRDTRSQTIVAAIGIAGAVVTKVEGASFAVALVLAMLLDRRPLRQIVAVIVPGAVLLGGWLVFVIRAGLLDAYRGPGELSFRYLSPALKVTLDYARYDALWIPWIAPLIVVALGTLRRARLPLSIAVLTVGVTFYVYLRSSDDPSVFWIPSSAQRVLLTPVAMLLLAAAAAHAPEEKDRAVVGEDGNVLPNSSEAGV